MVALCERTVIAGKYRLSRELAAGGMGAVWVARHLALDEDVAIKFMSAALAGSAEARTRFAREARAAARLRSPHVVQILDHGIDGDRPYLVMELLEGEHLGERLRRDGRLSLATAAAITEQIARALTRAHRAGIVHRDLKPANVFLARADDDEIVKLLDFGIAKLLGADVADATHTDILVGSPQYMSPEQARGSRELDHRADLWSLGAILFRALTGAPAFEGQSAVDVIVSVCAGPVPRPSEVAPDLPAEVDAFFARALDRDPSRRFQSAREMADQLGALAARHADAPTLRGASAARRLPSDRPTDLLGAPPTAAAEEILGDDDVEAFVEHAFEALVTVRTEEGDGAPEAPDARPPASRAVPESTWPVLRPFGGREVESGDRWIGRVAPSRVRGAVATLIHEGFTALRRGERDTARRVWQAALGLDPSNRELEANLRRLRHS